MKRIICLNLLIILFPWSISVKSQSLWGRLANPGFENHYIKSTYFFAGNWRNGVQFYEYDPSDNTGLYTLHPSDSRHLGWSENLTYRNFAVNSMIDVGANMINMSFWGPRGTDNWVYWAPMQTSTYAHDELFDVALGKNILVAPYIESYAATTNSQGFSFLSCFPGNASDPAPELIILILDLVDRYLIHPDNAQWPEVWARAYDQDGTERYIVSIIHVSSDQGGVSDQSFAEGFDNVADSIFNSTGIRIGFLLDALPTATFSPGSYKITPENADAWLADQKSILGIQCFIPEIWTGYDNDIDLIAWKREYCQRWSNTEIPFIIDLSPGYDAHVVFPESMIYGNNQVWRDSLTSIVGDIAADGITMNTWNGYTEGFAVVPTLEFGSTSYTWMGSLYEKYTIEEPPEETEAVLSLHNRFDIFPNPSCNNISVIFTVPSQQKVTLKVYDIQGREIAVLVNEEKQEGSYTVTFSTRNLPDGIYFYQLIAGEIVQTRKCIVSK